MRLGEKEIALPLNSTKMFWKRSNKAKIQEFPQIPSQQRTVELRSSQESQSQAKTGEQTLYVLRCEDSCWYVGISGNFKARWKQHHTGRGAEWTKVHKPISVESTRQVPEANAKDEERLLTVQMMLKYGVNFVRGAALTLSRPYDLTPNHVSRVTNVIYKAIGGDKQKIREIVRKDLGDDGETENTLQQNNEADVESDISLLGSLLSGIRVSAGNDSRTEDENCSRCGRNSHVRSTCYARTHLNGTVLLRSS